MMGEVLDAQTDLSLDPQDTRKNSSMAVHTSNPSAGKTNAGESFCSLWAAPLACLLISKFRERPETLSQKVKSKMRHRIYIDARTPVLTTYTDKHEHNTSTQLIY